MKMPNIIGWALAGAFIWVSVVALYRSAIILKGGYSLGSVPLDVLLIDVMNLHWHAVYGLLGGGLIGSLEWVVVSIRARHRRHRPRNEATELLEDVDLKLKLARASRANAYLEARAVGQRAVPARGEPSIENIVTARNGRFTYRVLAHRRLSDIEMQTVVRNALSSGTAQEPEPGGTTTILSDIT